MGTVEHILQVSEKKLKSVIMGKLGECLGVFSLYQMSMKVDKHFLYQKSIEYISVLYSHCKTVASEAV